MQLLHYNSSHISAFEADEHHAKTAHSPPCLRDPANADDGTDTQTDVHTGICRFLCSGHRSGL